MKPMKWPFSFAKKNFPGYYSPVSSYTAEKNIKPPKHFKQFAYCVQVEHTFEKWYLKRNIRNNIST